MFRWAEGVTALNTLHAFLFGFSLAIAIGPIALLIVHNGINHGLRVAVRSGVGAATADFLYALLAFAVGGGIVAALAAHAQIVRVMSAGLLIGIGGWLAWRALDARAAAATGSQSRGGGLSAGFWMTLGLTLANPLTLVLFIGFAGQLSQRADSYDAVYYALCIFLGSCVVQMALALLGASIGKWLASSRVIAVLNFASGIAIVAFGVRGAISAL